MATDTAPKKTEAKPADSSKDTTPAKAAASTPAKAAAKPESKPKPKPRAKTAAKSRTRSTAASSRSRTATKSRSRKTAAARTARAATATASMSKIPCPSGTIDTVAAFYDYLVAFGKVPDPKVGGVMREDLNPDPRFRAATI